MNSKHLLFVLLLLQVILVKNIRGSYFNNNHFLDSLEHDLSPATARILSCGNYTSNFDFKMVFTNNNNII